MRTALSTSFCGQKDVTWRKVLDGVERAGAVRVELSYNLRPEVARQVIAGLKQQGLKVESAHHPFPFPEIGLPEDPYADLFNPVSPLLSERRAACELIKDSLRAAKTARAEALVVHLGSLPELATDEEELWKRFKAGENVDGFASRYLKRRMKRSRAYLERSFRSLEDVLPVAEDLGVTIGLENRYFLMSFPCLEEFVHIFETFDSPFLGYWHDVGHGVVRAHFGYEDTTQVARALRGRLVGMHVHDAVGVKDHRAPGDGEVDFLEIFELFGVPGHVVFEPGPDMALGKLRSGLEYMERVLEQLGPSGAD